jgi:hypothetical protein
MMAKPQNRNNYKYSAPPPNHDDLVFQTCAFDPRIGGPRVHSQLSPQFFNGILGDKTLTWQLGDKIKRAGKVLTDTK